MVDRHSFSDDRNMNGISVIFCLMIVIEINRTFHIHLLLVTSCSFDTLVY